MTEVSLQALQAMFAQETEEVFLSCLTLTHPDLSVPIRVVNNTEDVVRAAGTFIGCPFEVALPSSKEGQLPQVDLRVDNVDPAILNSLRGLSQDEDVKCLLEVVLASTPDTIEAGPFDFTLRSVNYDAMTIDAALAFEDILNDRYPADDFTPTNSPGLF